MQIKPPPNYAYIYIYIHWAGERDGREDPARPLNPTSTPAAEDFKDTRRHYVQSLELMTGLKETLGLLERVAIP